MKTLATHPELVRAWLLALAGMPLQPPQQVKAQPARPLPPGQPYRH